MSLSSHRESRSRIRRWNVRNFKILIVSAVKICKQCLQTASVSGGLPTGASPLDPTARDFCPPEPLGDNPNEKSWGTPGAAADHSIVGCWDIYLIIRGLTELTSPWPPEMCVFRPARGRGRVRKLFERPRKDADATLRSFADTPHSIRKLHVGLRDECQ